MVEDSLAQCSFVGKIHEIHIVRGGDWSDIGQQSVDTTVEIVMGQYRRTGRKRLQQCCGRGKPARENESCCRASRSARQRSRPFLVGLPLRV